MIEINMSYASLKKAIRAGKTIIVTDYSNYEWNKSTDGGSYSYSTRYKYRTGKYWEYHSTSADFSYCDICATFTPKCGCKETDRDSFFREELITYLGWIYDQKPKGIEIEIDG